MGKHILRNTSLTILVLLFIASCGSPSYRESNKKTMQAMASGDYASALHHLDKNRFLHKKYNKVLYLMEKGRLQLLNKQYADAFENLNLADVELDAWKELTERDIIGNVMLYSKTKYATSTFKYKPFGEWFKAPHKVEYRPAHYERILIHYYKAICLLMMNRTEEAVVEAKQLNLLSGSLDDYKYTEPDRQAYLSDPMPQMMAGILFELEGDENSAFIEYANAWKKYLNRDLKLVYGVTVPLQLQNDLLRLSYRLEFGDRLEQYEREFGVTFRKDTIKSDLILLIDNGVIPHKEELRESFFMSYGVIRKGYDRHKNSASFSMPHFIQDTTNFNPVTTITCRSVLSPELLYNPNHITLHTLNRRNEFQRDIYLKDIFKGDSVNKRSLSYKTVDTRNWQTVARSVQYLRIPLDTGLNSLFIEYRNGKKDTLSLRGDKRHQFHYLSN